MPAVILTTQQRSQLEGLLNNSNTPRAVRRRARLILLYDDGHDTETVARMVGLSDGNVRRWRRHFLDRAMEIFPEVTEDEAGEDSGEEQAVATPAASEAAEGSLPEDGEPIASEQTSPITAGAEQASSPPPAVPDEPAILDLKSFTAAARHLKRPGVEPGDPLAEAGRKVLRYHFAQMLLHEPGTREGSDIEELHDMRVATRRMRAAMEVFGGAYRPKALRPHLKGLKATGRTLGRVRDLDVFMEKAQSYQSNQAGDQGHGLQPLLDNWQADRQVARDEMLAYLDSEAYTHFTEAFYKFLTTPGAGASAANGHIFTPQRVCEIAPILIYIRLAAARAFDAVLETATLEQLHALRIEFKKLRYTVEFFREVLGETSKAVIDDIKRLQDHLGDLNDAQVATHLLRDFLTRWDEQQAGRTVSERESPAAIMEYLSYQYAERHRLMITFRQAWEHFNRPEFRANLAQAVAVL